MFNFEDKGIDNFLSIHNAIKDNLIKLTDRPKEKWQWLAQSYNQALTHWIQSCPLDHRLKSLKHIKTNED